MKPEIKQKLIRAYGDYTDSLFGEDLKIAMCGYLDAFYDLGLITENELWTACENLRNAREE